MQRKEFTIWKAIAILCGLGIIAVVAFPFFARSRESDHRTPRSVCQSNLKQIALGVLQYTQDYDERYPFAQNSRHGLEHPTNWIGVLQPYLKSIQLFKCPLDDGNSNSQKSSYAYNAWLNKQTAKNLNHPNSTILNFEVQSDPNNWTQTGTGPQAVSAKTRHDEGAHYSFADGHVKWLKPEKITAEKPNGKNYTFAIQ